MKFRFFLTALVLVLFSCGVSAQQSSGSMSSGSDLSTADAVTLAHTAVMEATKMGYNVSATVVDVNGVIVATVKSEKAWAHTPKTSFKKAFTTIVAGKGTSELIQGFNLVEGMANMNKFIVDNLNQSDNIVLLGGGIPLKKGGKIVGAIGVGGAPGGHLDDEVIMATLVSLGWAD